MILLRKARFINWYAFSDETIDIGFFTLIAGRNRNGKSVVLDAIKYAAFGDTVFNKSSESKGSRTLPSYTRGFLDATAGTCIRPADRVPHVYTHVVLEFYDDVEEKPFLLGTIIETSASNNCQSFRYVVDRKVIEQLELTCMEDGKPVPYSASALQKKYNLTLMNREHGLPKFMQMMGLKMGLGQLPAYLRKLRGILSYEPNARIDSFIRESVLEKRDVDFGKLVEAKGNIERLKENFKMIQQEIKELDGILNGYDAWENDRKRILKDDIRIVYKKIKDLEQETDRQIKARNLAIMRKEDAERKAQALERKKKELDEMLIRAKVNLERMDASRLISEEERQLERLASEKKELLKKCKKLDHFQSVINGLLGQFFRVQENMTGRQILSSLCSYDYSASEKAVAVSEFKENLDRLYEEQIRKISDVDRKLQELCQELDAQYHVLEECKKHQNTYRQIPEYAALRDEINREFAKRGISSQAQFACEYVISLKDEAWRNALEAFLGLHRYTILVDPEYYDIADSVQSRSKYRSAHLFNTKLLMERKVQVEEDSAVHMLEIKNPVAQRYFAFQLGRMHAVPLGQVRNFENAISKEGRVSVAMDSYFMRTDRITYYLGQKTFELNRIRAEKEISALNAEKKKYLEEKVVLKEQKSRMSQSRELFGEHDYDAHKKYHDAAAIAREAEARLTQLKKTHENNLEYIGLNEQVSRLSAEQQAVQTEYNLALQEKSGQDAVIRRCSEKIKTMAAELEGLKNQYREYEEEHHALVRQAVESYEHCLENGEKIAGGLLTEDARKRIRKRIDQHKSGLVQKQASYNAKHPGGMLPVGTEGRPQYADRRETIRMDNLQEIQEKMKEQARRYEEIFKNEFVLTIFRNCERARDDLKQINRELGKLDFASKYQFDVRYVKDGSDFAKVIEYARYLDEREQLNGGIGGQLTLGGSMSVSDEDGQQLEREMEKIVNRIMQKNSEEAIARFADYRNYMTYEILVSNQVLNRAKLSRQVGFNSGAEVQIPYLLILSSALLMIYNQRVNSTRLVFIDEPFAKMDPGNVKLMLDFMRNQRLQVIFCSPDKTETIGNECEVILAVSRVRPDVMKVGKFHFHSKAHKKQMTFS